MAKYDASRIRKPPQTKSVEHLLNTNNRHPYIIGFDSEADTSSDGRPMCFQYSLPNTEEVDTIIQEVPETKHAGLGCFLDFLTQYCRTPRIEYLIYVWNESYELTQLFHDFPQEVINESEWSVKNISKQGTTYPWAIEIANDKRQIITFRTNSITIKVLDGTAFYKTSLDKAAKMLGLGSKYELVSLNRSNFTRRDLRNTEFITYAKRDAYVTRLIGEYIQRQHQQFGIRTCISAPHFAATVFRTSFLSSSITNPPEEIEQAGLYSYHGGKNGYYVEEPAIFPTIYNYDITSAYPEAMRQLPDIENSSWKAVSKFKPKQHGLYHVTLNLQRCKYGSLPSEYGTWNLDGTVTVWTTSYELEEVLSQREATIISCTGYVLLGPSGGALQRYVDRFFEIKRTTKGPERETAKLLLNALYGKFFQKQSIGGIGRYDLDNEEWIREERTDQNYDYEAGGLYNPPIASLITGFVRAKIHHLEHKYESVMTSTDGLFGINPPDERDIGGDLGKLTIKRGSLRIWRERLYIFDPIDGERKFALHGFHGHLNCGKEDCWIGHLEDIPLTRGTYTYLGQQLITLKMSTRDHRARTYSPGQFAKMEFTLRI